MYRLIDTHAHLDEIGDLTSAITEAKAAGVIAIIAVGSDYQSNQKVLQLAQTYRGFIYPAIGLHPYRLKEADIDRELEFIEAHMGLVVGVGEIGLDYHKRVRAEADKAVQKYVLKEILKIAKKYEKPVSVHSRYAWRDTLTLVEEAQIDKAVFHWYAGTSSVLRDTVSRGYYISATPAVEYHVEHRRAVKEITLARLLLETDSPVTYQRGGEFEYEARPAAVLRVLQSTAELKGISAAQLAEVTTGNALAFFGLPNLADA